MWLMATYVELCKPFDVVWIDMDYYENGSLWFSMLIGIDVKWDMVVSCDWYICGY